LTFPNGDNYKGSFENPFRRKRQPMPQRPLPKVNGLGGAALKPMERPRPSSVDDSLVLVRTKDTRIPNRNPALCRRYGHLSLHCTQWTPTTSLVIVSPSFSVLAQPPQPPLLHLPPVFPQQSHIFSHTPTRPNNRHLNRRPIQNNRTV